MKPLGKLLISGLGTALLAASTAHAATYTWTQTAGGARNWDDGINWSDSLAPSPVSGDTVDFSTVNIANDTTLTLGADRTAEVWKFGDTNNDKNWIVAAGNKMILAGTTPTIQVNTSGRTATLNNALDGIAGLTKDGAGTLVLGGTNTFTGGVTIKAGTLTYSAIANMGASGSRSVTFSGSGTLNTTTSGTSLDQLTVSGSASARINTNNISFTSATGAGTIVYAPTTVSPTLNLNDASGFTGNLQNDGGSATNAKPNIQFSSLGDTASSFIRYAGGTTDSNQTQSFTLAGNTGPLTFDNRTIEFVAKPANWSFRDAILRNNNATPANKFVINTNLSNLTDRNHNFVLGGSNTGDNEFAGVIGDSTRGTYYEAPGRLSLQKADGGTWLLSDINTYSGATTVTAGKLVGVVGGSCSNSAVTVSAGTLGVAVTDNTLQWACKSLTHSATSTLNFAFGATVPSTTVAPLKVEGNVAFNVAPTVTCTGDGLTGLAAGAYPLLKWTGALSGFVPSAVTLDSGSGVLLRDDANKTLWLMLGSSRAAITWQGPAGSEWKANESSFTYWQDATPAETYYQENTVGGLLVGDSVLFGATGVGTVTLNTTVTPLAVSVSTNDPDNYTISGSGGIAGGGGLTKAGSSTLILATDNTYIGGTTINAGTLQVGNGGTSGTLGSGSVANNATLTFNRTTSVTVGPMSGAGALIQNGSGTLIFGGADTSTGTITVNPGCIVDRNGYSGTHSQVLGSGTVKNTGGPCTLTINGAGYTFPGDFTGAGLSLTFLQSGQTYTLTGNSTHGGGTRIGGASHPTTVRLGVSNALPSGGAVTVDASGVAILNLNGFDQTVGLLSLGSNNGGSQATVTGSGTSKLTLTAGAKLDGHNNGAGLISVPTLDLNGTTQTLSITGSNHASSNLTVSSVIQNGGLTYNGGTSTLGALILSGANTYAGPTLNSFGMLRLDNKLALQNSPVDTSGAGVYNLNNGAGTYTLGGLIGTKNLASVITTGLANLTTLTLNPQTGSEVAYSGIIANGSMAVTKTGDGTQILSGLNSYTGATTVSKGKLLVNSPGSLHASSAVTVGTGTGGTLGGTGTINGSVTVAADGSLAPGASAGTLTIGGNLDLSAPASGGSGKLVFELDALANPSDKIAVTGTLTIGVGVLGFSDFVFTNLGGLQVTGATPYKLITSGGITALNTLDPANLTGTLPGGLTGTLQLTGNDLELAVTSGGSNSYLSWATANGVSGGETGDSDNDGVMNLVEYALVDGGERGELSGYTITFTKRGAPYGSDLTYTIETSETMAAGSWTDAVTHGPELLGSKPTISYTFTPGTPVKKFARLKVVAP